MNKILSAILLSGVLVIAGCTSQTTDETTNTAVENTNAAESTTVAVDADTTATDTATDADTTTDTTATDTDAGMTLADVATHDSESDCWMVIEDKVYDVTDYGSAHPGGDEIYRGCGLDATQMFATQGGEGSHSSAAEVIKDTYYIGDLAQ